MKVFTVYKHQTKGYVAVKVGFSWPAFFFTAIWMLIKGFFFLFIFFLVANWAFIFYSFISELNFFTYRKIMSDEIYGWYAANQTVIGLIGLLIWFIPGFNGNAWLDKKYQRKGYIEVKVISATSKETAIALAKNEKIQNPTYENIKSQDSIQQIYYSEAYKEIENYENATNKNEKMQYIKNPSLWARAFAESDGEEIKQKAIYVKLRTNELNAEYVQDKEQTNTAKEIDKKQKALSKNKSVGSKIFFYSFIVILILVILYLSSIENP